MSKISIIVPVYNTEPYLARCVDSILSQSFADFELLIVDDGSTDGSSTICDKYATKDNRVRVFHKENGGVSSARNMGLREAKGEWVCFVDSDDELLSNGLQVMAGGISDDIDLVMAGYEIFDFEGNLLYSLNKRVCKRISSNEGVLEMYNPMDLKFQGYICGKLYKKRIMDKHHLCFDEDLVFSEDRLFVTKFICKANASISYMTMPVYRYFERQSSAMGSLKHSFNKGVITDLDARIRMKCIVNEKFDNKELNYLTDFDVYRGLRRIVGFMQDFGFEDRRIKRGLHRKCIGAIGLCSYLSFEKERNGRRLKKKIRKVIGNNKEL